MGRAKEIEVKVLPSKVANAFVKRHHYSGKVVQNSSLHFGCFLDGKLHGVLQYGPSMSKHSVIGLVKDTQWNEFIELNRMAFDDYLPRNAESYCIGKTLRLIKRHAPHIKWVISFADATQCGDGTIYRASNFTLTAINRNKTILEFPNGTRIASLSLYTAANSPKLAKLCKELGVEHRFRSIREWKELGARPVEGYQLRYIYFIDKKSRAKLTVPEVPFSKIDEMGAGMYRGGRISRAERHSKLTPRQIKQQTDEQTPSKKTATNT